MYYKTYEIGDKVVKDKGEYRWPGVVIGVVETTSYNVRYVVECLVPGVAGALHIFSASQLVAMREEHLEELNEWKAAPYLMEALELTLPLAKGYRDEPKSDSARRSNNGRIQSAEIAIAKARGEQQ